MATQERPILVSACLAGIPCRYDGRARAVPEIVALVREGLAVPICPEVLGGLPTPRPPAEIRVETRPSPPPAAWQRSGGSAGTSPDGIGNVGVTEAPGSQVLDGAARVQTEQGVDVTEAYLEGAHKTLQIAREVGARLVVFKEKSPSCGVHTVFDGSFQRRLRPGFGVTTALLRRHDFEVINEEEFQNRAARSR
ncbi:MAG: DUF523 domain-containing protein [Limnochordales bacterium]|nr:DUF523 domain-containing protein [Limnochordales bacterium]